VHSKLNRTLRGRILHFEEKVSLYGGTLVLLAYLSTAYKNNNKIAVDKSYKEYIKKVFHPLHA
jgi:hypothetical protein